MKSMGVLVVNVSVALTSSALCVETNYFILKSGPSANVQDALIVPINDPDLLVRARALIKNGYNTTNQDGRFFPVTRVIAGRDGLNRNYAVPSLLEWSWHVKTFLGFAEAVGGDANTAAWILEYDYDWQNNPPPEMTIAFGGYRFVRELGPTPFFATLSRTNASVELYWNTPQTNWTYIVQQNAGLVPTDWVPVPGFAWPAATNHVTLPLTNAILTFRLKAENNP